MCQLLHSVQLLSQLFLTRAEKSAARHRTQADPVASAFAWARDKLAKWRDHECNGFQSHGFRRRRISVNRHAAVSGDGATGWERTRWSRRKKIHPGKDK
eukprot:4603446-Pyramimonas_sp.AAC.1